MANNCYILSGDGRTAVVIDPATEYGKIGAALDAVNLTAKYVLLTHGHFDHHGAARALQEMGAEIYLNKNDWYKIKDGLGRRLSEKIFASGHDSKTFTPDHDLTGGEVLDFAGLKIEVVGTPGHTSGGVCFFIGGFIFDDNCRFGDTLRIELPENIPVLFSGDTLFHTDVGRTDLTDGDFTALKRSVLEKLYTLPPETIVWPGHEEETTIGEERENNLIIRIE